MSTTAGARSAADASPPADERAALASIFPGDGEMARRCRELDWAATPLGPVTRWSHSLRTTAGIVLTSRQPMFLFWGPELVQLYNDAYRPSLGREGRHPRALGARGKDFWTDIWDAIGPQIHQVMTTGEATWHEDQYLPIERNGRLEDVWWTYSYSPVRDDDGSIRGTLVVCQETTARVRLEATVEAERSRFAELFRQSPSFLAVLRGPDNVFELVNDAYEQIVGYGRNAVGKPLFDALPEARGQGFDGYLARVRETGESIVFRDLPVQLQRTPGAPLEERFIDITYLPLIEADGSHPAVIAHGTDVTDQVRARREVERTNTHLQEQAMELELSNQQLQEQATELEAQAEELQVTAEELERAADASESALRALAASDARLRMALHAAHLVAWEWDPAQERITTTDNLREVYGVDALDDSAAGFALVHPDDRIRHQQTVATAIERGGEYQSEFRIVRPDTGETVWLEEHARALRDADGRLIKVVGVVTDVTIRKQADFKRGEHEGQIRSLADAIPTLAWTARADGYIDWYNARWYEYTGTTAEQMQGWGWQNVHDSAMLPKVMERWQASIASGEPFEMTFPLRGVDGRFRRFLTRVTPLRDASNAVVRWFGTNTDVEAERAAREAAEGANQAKTDFLATMSHELRTPLNAIAGYAELMELEIHGPVTDGQRDAINRIQRSQRHLLGLINDVLNFAKLEAGRVEYHLADVSVHDTLDAIEPLVAPQLRGKGLRFTREDCATAHTVRADPDKLEQILVNLLSNAIKFTGKGGAVTVHCRAEAGVVAVAIEDTGVGIPADRLEQVFAPFVQIARRLNAPHEGTGLGLAISRDLARAMGGDLVVESEVGRGSTFTLTLPAIASEPRRGDA